MQIKALKNCFSPSHSLKKGDVVDMRKQDAEKLIAKDLAKKATKADQKKNEGVQDG